MLTLKDVEAALLDKDQCWAPDDPEWDLAWDLVEEGLAYELTRVVFDNVPRVQFSLFSDAREVLEKEHARSFWG